MVVKAGFWKALPYLQSTWDYIVPFGVLGSNVYSYPIS